MRPILNNTATTQKIIAELGRRQSFYPKNRGDNSWVSSKSRWKDPRWDLDNPTSGAGTGAARVNWDVNLPDGSNLLDRQNATLLEELRRFTWSLFADPRNGKALKAASAGPHSTAVKALACWMVKNNYAHLCELNSRAADRFAQDLIIDLEDDLRDDTIDIVETPDDLQMSAAIAQTGLSVDQDLGANGDVPIEDEEVEGISNGYVYPRLVIWKRLWDQREAIRYAGVEPIQEEPFGGQSIRKVSIEFATKAYGKIPPLPDEVAIPIMNAANAIVDHGGGDLIRMCQDALSKRLEIFGEDAGPEVWTEAKKRKAKAALSDFSFSVPDGWEKPWRSSLADEEYPSRVLRSLIDQMITACSIVLQSETGMRISEVMSIRAGIDSQTGLPKCIRLVPSRSGMLDLFYVSGFIAKTRAASEETEWLLCARPHGSKASPTAIRAIEVLQHMLEPFRRMAESESVRSSLFISLRTPNALPVSGKGVTRALSTTILAQQKRFAEKVIDWDCLASDPRLGRYKDSRGACIKTHQWRKNYARFVFQTNRKMIPAVARQFKHLSIAMTEQAYVGTDISLIYDVAEENRNMTVDLLLLKARGKGPKHEGRLAKLMDKYQSKLAEIIEGKNDRDARKAMEAWCSQRNLKLFFHGYGSCIPALAPAEAECHKRAQTVHWANKEPNYATREPSVCTGCYLFLAGPETLEYWANRYVKNMNAWLIAKTRGEERLYHVAKARADQSANYLKFWGEELPGLSTCTENERG